MNWHTPKLSTEYGRVWQILPPAYWDTFRCAMFLKCSLRGTKIQHSINLWKLHRTDSKAVQQRTNCHRVLQKSKKHYYILKIYYYSFAPDSYLSPAMAFLTVSKDYKAHPEGSSELPYQVLWVILQMICTLSSSVFRNKYFNWRGLLRMPSEVLKRIFSVSFVPL